MKRHSILRRTPLHRRKPLPRINRRRADKRKAEQFGEQAARCRHTRCVFCVALDVYQSTCSVPHHWPTRARGGLDEHTGPVCVVHHEILHRMGHERMCRRYGVDWSLVLERMRGAVVDGSPVSMALGEWQR